MQSSQFFCPLKCDLSPFHTMTFLLGHCQSVHDDSLGKYNKIKVNNILSALVYSINGALPMDHNRGSHMQKHYLSTALTIINKYLALRKLFQLKNNLLKMIDLRL